VLAPLGLRQYRSAGILVTQETKHHEATIRTAAQNYFWHGGVHVQSAPAVEQRQVSTPLIFCCTLGLTLSICCSRGTSAAASLAQDLWTTMHSAAAARPPVTLSAVLPNRS